MEACVHLLPFWLERFDLESDRKNDCNLNASYSTLWEVATWQQWINKKTPPGFLILSQWTKMIGQILVENDKGLERKRKNSTSPLFPASCYPTTSVGNGGVITSNPQTWWREQSIHGEGTQTIEDLSWLICNPDQNTNHPNNRGWFFLSHYHSLKKTTQLPSASGLHTWNHLRAVVPLKLRKINERNSNRVSSNCEFFLAASQKYAVNSALKFRGRRGYPIVQWDAHLCNLILMA